MGKSPTITAEKRNLTPVKTYAPITAAAVAGIALFSLTACATNESAAPANAAASSPSSQVRGTIAGAGASSQAKAQEVWISAFQTANPDATVEYDPSGSGAGRESFQQGAVAFAGSDRAFKQEEIATGTFAQCQGSGIVEIPAYLSPIAVIFNLPGVSSLNLDANTIAGIFAGTITRWNDPAIVAQNPGGSLPDLAISPVHRADKSGTTGNFTDYLAAAAPSAWSFGSVEEWPAGLGGEAANQTSGLVDVVTKSPGTIGYADASKAGSLGTVKVKVGDAFVAYSPAGAAAVVDASPLQTGRSSGDLAVKLDRTTTVPGAYPIVLISYLIGCEQYQNPANAEVVKAYFSSVVSEAGQNAASKAAGNAPISAKLRTSAQAAIDSIK